MKLSQKDVREIERIDDATRRELDDANWDDIVPRLLYYAFKLARRYNFYDHTASTAEDAVYYAILKTYSGERKWNKDKVSLLTFLMGAVRSALSNEVRRKKNVLEAEKSFETENYASSFISPEDSLEISERRQFLKNYISFLKEEYPDLFVVMQALLSEEHKSKGEVAKYLAVSQSSLSKKIERLTKVARDFRSNHVGKKDVNKARSAK